MTATTMASDDASRRPRQPPDGGSKQTLNTSVSNSGGGDTTTATASPKSVNNNNKKKKSKVNNNKRLDLNNHKHDELAFAATAASSSPNTTTEDTGFSHIVRVVRSNSLIWVVPLLVFVALTVSGITVVFMHFDNQESTRVDQALSVASETGKRFSDFLDNSITPLFSLAQFVHELDEFRHLPDQIGPLHQNGSLPMVTNSTKFRNITGVCDEPHLTERFHGIASTIKRNAKQMRGVLVNLQLVPEGVVCLLHPVVNTEDFPPGKALNSSGAIGHDLIADPARRFHAEESLREGELVTVGPIQLVQCQGCDPIVEQAFIARLPILMEGHDILTHDGVKLPRRWGFAVALINWQVLVEKTYLYEDFALRGWAFQLTRNDYKYDADTQSYQTEVVVLAETSDFAHKYTTPKHHQVVETRLDTTDSEWTLKVVYSLENAPAWKSGAIALIVLITALISFLAAIVLYQKQVHSELVKANLVRAERSARAERDLNDFIAHEIRNPLSAAMSAGTFLATTVEEEQQRYQQRQQQQQQQQPENAPQISTDERQSLLSNNNNNNNNNSDSWSSPKVHQTIQEDVGIINSSLHFINDLLRNMLDMHRAASRQLVLVPVETDLCTDVLEPVAAMLQLRDRNFQIHIQMDDTAPNPFLIQIDRLRLQQVIINLGRNSAKFVPDGPQSFVRLRAGLDEVDGSVILSVEDSGCGIPPSKRTNLFGRFQESLDSLSQGTGVGLNLCRTLVELMGGELYLDETYDSGVEGYPGARFVVHLKGYQVMDTSPPPSVEFALTDNEDEPAIDHVESPKECSASHGHIPNTVDVEMGGVVTTETGATGATGALEERSIGCSAKSRTSAAMDRSGCHNELPENLKVLFVDDERILRKLALRAFSRLAPSWTVEETASGEAALQLVVEKHYDMVFLDQYFTSVERRLTGTETARAMRAKGVTCIICGVSANDLEGAFLANGADIFTTKPFATNQEQLKRFMVKALASRKQRVELEEKAIL